MNAGPAPDGGVSAARRSADRLVAELRRRAESLGFDAFGIADPAGRPDLPEKLRQALDSGWHGDMDWMEDTFERRARPATLWSDVRSVIMLGVNYGPDHDPMLALENKSTGNISAYARNRDYHDIIKGRLKDLAGLLARRTGAGVKVFVDTAPVMEKPLAQGAGLGWQGKHTVLVSRQYGSWLFLGAIFTSVELPYSTPQPESCGSCTRCLDICPTNAFPAPFQLDARRCLAYLNIEHKGQIPVEFRAPMGNRIYGCDDCQLACPWNKFAQPSPLPDFDARAGLTGQQLVHLFAWDEATFLRQTEGGPIRRIGHERWLRNIAVALGNALRATGDPAVRDALRRRTQDPSALVREHVAWALAQETA